MKLKFRFRGFLLPLFSVVTKSFLRLFSRENRTQTLYAVGLVVLWLLIVLLAGKGRPGAGPVKKPAVKHTELRWLVPGDGKLLRINLNN